jgi:hypothetical protein
MNKNTFGSFIAKEPDAMGLIDVDILFFSGFLRPREPCCSIPNFPS